MKPLPSPGRRSPLAAIVIGLALCVGTRRAYSAADNSDTNEIRIVAIRGSVEIIRKGTTAGVRTETPGQVLNSSDRLVVGTNSLVELLVSGRDVVRFGPGTTIEVLPPQASGAQTGFSIIRGLLSFFGRDKPGRFRIVMPGADAGVNGTEFVVKVEILDGVEITTISVIDGEVQFTSGQSPPLVLRNKQQSVAEKGKPPSEAKGFIANNVLQWCLYYPAVLDLRDLPLTAEEEQALSESLAAYRQGDLLHALQKYPVERHPSSDAERLYYASLLLSVGRVDQTEASLDALPTAGPADRIRRLANALRQLIAAVRLESNLPTLEPRLPTEFLAASYYAQSRTDRKDSLDIALHMARQAATNSPEFGFAWARVAELEFSFGHTRRALEALNRSLNLATNNAQALSLKGFLFAAENNIREAMVWFNQAITLDSGLGNAWLGRGLCRIRRGDTKGGRDDLLIAAALEPQRALLRSYLGKAYANDGDTQRASHELDLAKHLDCADPTAWLYSALLNEQNNRFNEGIQDLEKSQQLNSNRRLYRSRLLLDQDQAVRGSSLANLYRDSGMPEVSVCEAARTVSYNYANYSAHLFLAESFDALRDPTRFNLRYETPWFNELLLANLLSPVGGTPLSQNISQQEYARLFDQDRIGLGSSTEYRSDGQVRELASQYGNIGNTGWSLDLDYQHNNGIRPNNGLDRIEWYSTIKQQLTAKDSVMLLTKYQDYHSGDNFQYYNPSNARPHFRFDEYQSPIAVGGYHHEWQPGIHTLLLGGRLENDQRFSDLQTTQNLLYRVDQNDPLSPVIGYRRIALDVNHRIKLEIYDAELQQIVENIWHTLVVGGHWQGGQFDTQSLMTNPSGFPFGSTNSDPATSTMNDFKRWSAYAYETLKLLAGVRMTAGLTYDHLMYPKNFRAPPVRGGEETREQVSPKASLVWELRPAITARGVYARSLGGVSLDESYQLEPTQLGGFAQTFRTLIPESLVGSVSAPDQEVLGGALDFKLTSRTYFGLQVERLHSEVRQTVGVYDLFLNDLSTAQASSTRQNLDYRENRLSATLNQLILDEWSVGAQYSFVRSELDAAYPDAGGYLPTSQIHADLHRVDLFLLYNHRSGLFAQAGWDFYLQSRSRAFVDPDIVTDVPNETLQQLNLLAGYRFPRQHGDLTLGVLNLTGEDYRLNPVTPYTELPRERVFYARLRFRF